MATAFQSSTGTYASERVFRSRVHRSGKIARTDARILETFAEMLAQPDFGTISVIEIADRCGIARSTAYRHFASTIDMLWALALPSFERALERALSADTTGFKAACAGLWSTPGLARALTIHRNAKVRPKLAAIATAALEKLWRNRNATTGGAIVAGAWFALLEEYAEASEPPLPELAELLTVIYTVGYLTPQGIRAVATAQASRGLAFPPAVSARESLSSDEYIISMIDGKPYRILTRHIARFGLKPDEYRRCFGLPGDYPMAAKAFSQRQRATKRQGLSNGSTPCAA